MATPVATMSAARRDVELRRERGKLYGQPARPRADLEHAGLGHQASQIGFVQARRSCASTTVTRQNESVNAADGSSAWVRSVPKHLVGDLANEWLRMWALVTAEIPSNLIPSTL